LLTIDSSPPSFSFIPPLLLLSFLDFKVAAGKNGLEQRTIDTKWRQMPDFSPVFNL
jgi:hypothetical protein